MTSKQQTWFAYVVNNGYLASTKAGQENKSLHMHRPFMANTPLGWSWAATNTSLNNHSTRQITDLPAHHELRVSREKSTSLAPTIGSMSQKIVNTLKRGGNGERESAPRSLLHVVSMLSKFPRIWEKCCSLTSWKEVYVMEKMPVTNCSPY